MINNPRMEIVKNSSLTPLTDEKLVDLCKRIITTDNLKQRNDDLVRIYLEGRFKMEEKGKLFGAQELVQHLHDFISGHLSQIISSATDYTLCRKILKWADKVEDLPIDLEEQYECLTSLMVLSACISEALTLQLKEHCVAYEKYLTGYLEDVGGKSQRYQ